MSSEQPIFTVARNREMIQRAVERARVEERQKIAAALEVQANSVGGVIGAALRQIASDFEQAGAMLVAARPARDFQPIGAVAEEERQRAEREAEERRLGAERLARQAREDDERIAREAEERRALVERGQVPREALDELPPVRLTSDEDDFHIAQRKLR